MSIATLVGTLAQNEPYKNHQLSPKERADDLLGRLTLKEKIGLMQNSSNAVERLGIAPYNWWSEGLHGVARQPHYIIPPLRQNKCQISPLPHNIIKTILHVLVNVIFLISGHTTN